MHGMRSTYSNFVHTTPAGTGGTILSDGCKSTQVTNSFTNGLWFQRFMEGCHKRMGDVRLPDAALTIDVIKALDKLWEDLWVEASQPHNAKLLHKISSTAFAVTCGFSSGLRGEELGHIRLRKSVILMTQGLRHPRQPHIVLAMEGRFKGQVSHRKHKIPLALVSASGIPNKKWFMRLCEVLEQSQIYFGPMLRPTFQSESPARILHLDVWFHKHLLHIQSKHPGEINPCKDISNSYSVRQSLRRGLTTQARNKRVPKDVEELNNRWRSDSAAGHREARGSGMIEVYTDVVAALETLLQYSAAL
ncbi:hypothetical protein ACA910_011548 [Epithemia clementina (nom. ined.)]